MEQAPSPPATPVPAAEPQPDWPPWYAFVGFLAALLCTFVAIGVIAAIGGIEAGDETPSLTIIATTVQGIFFVGAAVVFARSVAPPKSWHFGLRRAPFGRTLGWAALGMVGFYALTAIYAALVDPTAEQDVTESLGADEGLLGLIAAGTMVIVVAPVVEEIFFRGFFYRALRTRYPMILAALVDGLIFGLIHFSFEGADGLLILPPLMFLGVIFCLVYERTGTLYAVIGMHAFNNIVAFSAQTTDAEGWRVALIAGPLMLVAVAVVPKLLPDGPAPLPPQRQRVGPDPQLSLPAQ